MTVTRETREKINNEMADKVRDAIVRYCDDAEAVRAWFDDIMVLVWGAEEWSIPRDLLPGVEERKDLAEVWRKTCEASGRRWPGSGGQAKRPKALTELAPRLWRF